MKRLIIFLLVVPAICLAQFDSRTRLPYLFIIGGSDTLYIHSDGEYVYLESSIPLRLNESIKFDSTGAARTIDLSVEDDGSSTKHWIYNSANSWWRRDDYIKSTYAQFTSILYLSHDTRIQFGSQHLDILYETADANANMLQYLMPTGDATEVPVMLLLPKVLYNKNLGGLATPIDFSGFTQPTFGIVDADSDACVYLTFIADDKPGVALKGNASAFALPQLTDKDSLTTHQESSSIADDGEITLATGAAGWGQAMAGDNEEWAQFRFTSAGVVTLIANTGNVVNTDTDDKFCIYDAGSGIAVKNRLGAVKTVAVDVHYFTP